MLRFGKIMAGLAGVAALAGLAYPAAAQDYSMPGVATTKVGEAELSIGGGLSRLDLPDIRFGYRSGPSGNREYANSNGFEDEFGGSLTGQLVIPWGSTTALALGGFWSGIDQDKGVRCEANGVQSCEASNLTGVNASAPVGVDLRERAKRDVDHWGTQLEGRYYMQGAPGNAFVNTSYVALGGDIRQINQDTRINFSTLSGLDAGSYKESLDTDYYGAYVAIGGEYHLPFFENFKSGLGLESGFKAYAGLYAVDSDYNGRVPGNSLGLSTDDTAFIGGLTLETRKQFTPRTSLSLESTYEYISWVPEMQYSNSNTGQSTTIDDTDAFASRTMLRLNVGLGPDGLYYK
ncbi:hypothetical protein A7A08_01223 [Methyloligella halotolerans]|uniref:Uncharacterized protein n=1 Tax=Methyloligella halotolerans TaxID=1177755 RepID=A0A1E2S0M2_9HYPH|nr:hypothetical protein [Methyloligella halotolerans]ODA68053.1 hypothetical protein A7A08_01223 [Methyloligella halotolerans]